jgi:hypothetical protein
MDALVNESAALPRKLGFAPKNEDIYPTEKARKEARWVPTMVTRLGVFIPIVRSLTLVSYWKLQKYPNIFGVYVPMEKVVYSF